MCRVLGITNFDFIKHREIVTRFSELVRTGVVMAEDPPGHEDGWGLAFYRQGQLEVHKSGLSLLEETDRVIDLLKKLRTSPLMILHLRKSAWGDRFSTRHAHPFHHDNTVFFHNGVVYDYQGLLADITMPVASDALDTEVFFYHVLSCKAQGLDRKFLESAALIKRKHSYSALNCLFSDGKTFYAYRDYAKEADYYSLYKTKSDNCVLVSSEPLDNRLSWDMMAHEDFLAIDLAETI